MLRRSDALSLLVQLVPLSGKTGKGIDLHVENSKKHIRYRQAFSDGPGGFALRPLKSSLNDSTSPHPDRTMEMLMLLI